MERVRAHRRKNGSFVREHYRRSSGSSSITSTTRNTGRTTGPAKCRVSSYYRKDGTYVPTYSRSLPGRASTSTTNPPSAPVAAVVLVILGIIALGTAKAHGDPSQNSSQTNTSGAVVRSNFHH